MKKQTTTRVAGATELERYMLAAATRGRDRIRERAMQGMLNGLRKGRWPGSCPFGFRRSSSTGEVKVDPETWPTVKAIIAWFDNGLSRQEIVNELNRQGLPGTPISVRRVSAILQDPTYTTGVRTIRIGGIAYHSPPVPRW